MKILCPSWHKTTGLSWKSPFLALSVLRMVDGKWWKQNLNRFEDYCVCCQACQLRFYFHIQSTLSIFLLLRNTHTLKISPAWRLLCSSCWLWACEFSVSASGVLCLQVWVTMPWKYKYMNIHTHMCISIYHLYMYVCTYVYIHTCMHVCVYVLYVSIYLSIIIYLFDEWGF